MRHRKIDRIYGVSFGFKSLVYFEKIPEDKRRECFLDILDFIQVTGADHDEMVEAVKMKQFRDLEDCLQDKCAKKVSAEYIITRNVNDFNNSDIPAVLPEDFLNL